MNNYISLILLVSILVIYIARILVLRFNHKKYTKKINHIINKENNLEKALNEIEKELGRTKGICIEFVLLDKLSVLILIGKWKEAHSLIQSIGTKIKYKKNIDRFKYNYLLLKLYSEDFNSIDKIYSNYMINFRNNHSLNDKFIEFLYCVLVKNAFDKSLELSNEIIKEENLSKIYYAIYFYYIGVCYYKVGKMKESLNYIVKSKVYGHSVFIKEKADDMIKIIIDELNKMNIIISNLEIDDMINQVKQQELL